jgi:hypothetical protein
MTSHYPQYSCKVQLYRPNKHSYDTLVTSSSFRSLQCKNILKDFVVNEKAAKIQQQEKSRSLSNFAEKNARAIPFPHHIDQRDISALHRPQNKRPGSNRFLLRTPSFCMQIDLSPLYISKFQNLKLYPLEWTFGLQ